MELEKITTQYRKFTKGQYVEYDQFNEFLDSFEDQDRLSKILLRGVGINCGLEVLLIDKRIITISSGSGITTDGDLITLENISYDFYREYDNFRVVYPPFHKKGNQIELVEIIQDTKENRKLTDIRPISSLPNIENKYVVLYLESYEKDARPCKGVDCDSHGIEKVTNVRVLLTNKEGIEHIVSTDSIYKNETPTDLYTSLQEIILERPVLTNETDTASEINSLYKNILTSNATLQLVTNNFKRITDYFNKDNQLAKKSLNQIISSFLATNSSYNYQYAYAFLEELISTYNEIKELIPELKTTKFPNLKAFQKHLMLGKISNHSSFRHPFYASPILEKESIIKHIELLINRFNLQVERFSKFKHSNVEIQITPSIDKGKLGKKAIPFFYKADDKLRQNWDFCTTINRNSEDILSYFPSSSVVTHIQNPIQFNLEHNSFFRIEGHQGKSYIEVADKLNQQRFKNQLAFDVMSVSLTKLKKNDDQTKAFYKDYLEKHSGLQHKSGVYTGGTFILVYESERNPKVIADFTLPYLCCMKKQDIGLELPFKNICEDGERFIIVSEPINANVKAFVRDIEIKAIEKVGSQNYFNPSKVPTQYLDKTITFTINDKPVESEFIVKPVPVVTITTSIQYPEGNSRSFLITYSGLVSGFEYEFDFYGNGNIQKITPDTSGKYMKILESKKDEFKINTKIYVKNPTTGCMTDYTVVVESLPDIEIVSVGYPTNNCCLDLKENNVNTSLSSSSTNTKTIACFDLESSILMANDRSKKLKNIKIGDEITTHNFKNNLPATKKESITIKKLMTGAVKANSKVVDFTTKTVEEYREIILVNGSVLNITPSHPILASKDQKEVAWLLPDDIRKGAFLIDKNGEFVEVQSKKTIRKALEIGVLQIGSGNNYFVQGCMVHNAVITRITKEKTGVIENVSEVKSITKR